MKVIKYVSFTIVLLLGTTACSFSPERFGVGVGKWAISKARYQQLVGPSNKLIEAHGSSFSGEKNKEIEEVLGNILDDVRSEIIKLDETNIEPNTAHESLPAITIELVDSAEPYAVAVQGSNPRIEISSELVKNLMHPYVEELSENQGIDDPFIKVFSGLSVEARKVEIFEGLVFVIAHEVTHIWLDEVNEKSIESEVRADAYAVLISSELSLTADQRRKMMAQMMRTMSFSTSDPIAMIMMQAEIGGEIMLNVYKDSKFSDGNSTHLSIEDRMVRVEVELDNILDKRAKNTSVMESAFWAVVNDVLFE